MGRACFSGFAFAALAVPLDSDAPSPTLEAFDGFIEAYRVINLSSSTDGILEEVNVERGDFVRQGEVVAVLESAVEKATLEIARARVRLEGEIREQSARLEYSQHKFAQDANLHGQGIVSEDQLKQVRAEKLLSEAGLLKAHENVELAELELARASAALDLRTIRSPIDGVVIERFLSPGELMTKLSQSKVVAIAQVDPLRVEVLVPADLYSKVTAGTKAVVAPEGLEEARLDARVESTTPFIDAASGTFKVRLELANTDRRLPPGLKCRVRFILDAATRAPGSGTGKTEPETR